MLISCTISLFKKLKIMKKTLLWLDDYRDPFDKKIDLMIFSPIGKDINIKWV